MGCAATGIDDGVRKQTTEQETLSTRPVDSEVRDDGVTPANAEEALAFISALDGLFDQDALDGVTMSARR